MARRGYIELETEHLIFDEWTGRISIKCIDDEVCLGPLDDCDEECPSILMDELRQLRDLHRDSLLAGIAYDATRREADRARMSPGGW